MKKDGIYNRFVKRIFDFIISLIALLVLSPLLLALSISGAIAMGGNPFFTQERPGRNEKLFRLIKFRTMSNKTDENGKLLPDTVRLNKYGRILRATSLDELPELVNILIGDMSIVGPRPLGVKYLPYYTDEERHRHDLRPGLTGYAQVNGRNSLSWEQKFAYDLEYVKGVSLFFDIKILFMTVKKVVVREGIGQGEERPVSLHIERANKMNQTYSVGGNK